MSIYNELDLIISDYVGYRETDYEYDIPAYECDDPELYDKITRECSEHLSGTLPIDKMSKDGRICIENWENCIQSYKENYYERV